MQKKKKLTFQVLCLVRVGIEVLILRVWWAETNETVFGLLIGWDRILLVFESEVICITDDVEIGGEFINNVELDGIDNDEETGKVVVKYCGI